MPNFRYKAAGAGGEVLEGEMEAADQQAVIRRLQAQGHVPIRAEEITGATLERTRGPRLLKSRRVSQSDIAMFTLELATLLQAGVALDRALEMLAGLSESAPVRDMVDELNRQVRGGTFLSRAMEGQGGRFSRFYRNMVKAGEATGALDMALMRLAEFLQRARDLRDAVTSALIYPAILFFVACLSMAVILGVVVPRISAMFTEAGQELPWFTQIVVSTGGFVEQFWWVFVIVLVGVFLYARQQAGDTAARLKWDARFLKMPLVGNFITRLETARFTRTLGTLIGNGVPLLDAIAIAREVVGNQVMAAGLERVAGRVRQGEGLARPLQDVGVFPRLAGHLLQVGEESGNLESMLTHLASIYEREVQSSLRRMMAVIEPVLILGLAVVIAGIILSIVIALFSVNDLAF